MRGAHGDGSHAHTNRDAHLVSLTPLIEAAQARGCARRACAQSRLLGAPQAHGRIQSAPRNEASILVRVYVQYIKIYMYILIFQQFLYDYISVQYEQYLQGLKY